MRTTLDIDDQLLAIARVRAQEQGVSLGAAVSDLIRRGLEVRRTRTKRGFPVFEAPPGTPVITSEMVARYRDDDPTEE